MLAVDASVVIAGFAASHDDHDAAPPPDRAAPPERPPHELIQTLGRLAGRCA